MSGDGVRARIGRDDLKRAPHLTWNAFVDLLATADWGDLSKTQRLAYLAYWYDAEVQNGGHLRYFTNRGTAALEQTLAALERLGATGQREVLDRAGQLWLSGAGESAGAADELDVLDGEYHSCEPEIPALLKVFLDENLDEFIVLQGGEGP